MEAAVLEKNECKSKRQTTRSYTIVHVWEWCFCLTTNIYQIKFKVLGLHYQKTVIFYRRYVHCAGLYHSLKQRLGDHFLFSPWLISIFMNFISLTCTQELQLWRWEKRYYGLYVTLKAHYVLFLLQVPLEWALFAKTPSSYSLEPSL